jgi:large subunit ribosomal protein L13
MTVEKTFVIKGKTAPAPDWWLVDATGQNLGRLATQIAQVLLGKHKPTFTPGVDMGDCVVVVNAEKLDIDLKKQHDKMYYHHSLYPGGLTTTRMSDMLKRHPDRIITAAVWGMLPHNKLGRKLIKRLKVYAGPTHEHEAQQPKKLV